MFAAGVPPVSAYFFTMNARDTFESLLGLLAAIADAIAIFAGFMLAVWIRFESGWIPLHGDAKPGMGMYVQGSLVSTVLFVVIYRYLGLYARPQLGHFTERIPRIIRSTALGLVLATALAFAIRTEVPFSRTVAALSFFTVTILVIIERNVLFQLERHWAKYQAEKRNVLVLGAGPMAVRLRHALEGEPRLRSRIVGFLPLGGETPDPALPPALVRGGLAELTGLLQRERIAEVILANPSELSHPDMVGVMVECEKALADFMMVPDLFRMLTSRMNMQTVEGIPLLGIDRWPLDLFWNRLIKRIEDILGALVGIVLSAPVVLVAALLIRRESPGPVFYRQERCGEKGRPFTLYKLRTMRVDAEKETGPVWTSENDPRRTRIGGLLRSFNIDELPQFWNVLKGDMSLVGPRPERPHFVEQFKEDVSRYMWRHAYKPGMSGWAQVNGLRGNTSIQDRIKLDLFYLENWSLGLDFKILLLTFFARKNAY